MYCKGCKKEVAVDLDDEGLDYVPACRTCMKKAYQRGKKKGESNGSS